MDRKNKVALICFAIIILFLVIVVVKYIRAGNELNDLNNMYKDIRSLEDSISMYYLDNGSLPIKGDKIEFSNSSNPNDNENYYEIDLSLLDNLNLFYGRKQHGYNDIYLINENSHTVYYYEGIKYNKETFYTNKDVEYEKINLEDYK